MLYEYSRRKKSSQQKTTNEKSDMAKEATLSSTVTRRKGIRNKEVSWRLAPTDHVICLLPRNLLYICE